MSVVFGKPRFAIARRFAAALLALATLQASAARADACAAHAEVGAPAAETILPHHEGMSHESEPVQSEPCDQAGDTDCCVGITSCSMVLSAGSIEEPMAGGPQLAIATTVSARPLSTNSAPEPPPPRG
jgi:hypothetical protein